MPPPQQQPTAIQLGASLPLQSAGHQPQPEIMWLLPQASDVCAIHPLQICNTMTTESAAALPQQVPQSVLDITTGRQTLLWKNVPAMYTRDKLIEHLIGFDFKLGYDINFFYAPFDLERKGLKGFAFVSFTSHELAVRCMSGMRGFADWDIRCSDHKVSEFQWNSKAQGLAQNLETVRRIPVLKHKAFPPEHLPLLFQDGVTCSAVDGSNIELNLGNLKSLPARAPRTNQRVNGKRAGKQVNAAQPGQGQRPKLQFQQVQALLYEAAESDFVTQLPQSCAARGSSPIAQQDQQEEQAQEEIDQERMAIAEHNQGEHDNDKCDHCPLCYPDSNGDAQSSQPGSARNETTSMQKNDEKAQQEKNEKNEEKEKNEKDEKNEPEEKEDEEDKEKEYLAIVEQAIKRCLKLWQKVFPNAGVHLDAGDEKENKKETVYHNTSSALTVLIRKEDRQDEYFVPPTKQKKGHGKKVKAGGEAPVDPYKMVIKPDPKITELFNSLELNPPSTVAEIPALLEKLEKKKEIHNNKVQEPQEEQGEMQGENED